MRVFLQVPLSQSSAEALLGSLLGHHPCGVRDALCTLYDLGLIHFHEQVKGVWGVGPQSC
jgi:hypothetical protein